MSRIDDPSFGRPAHLRVEGSRVLMNLPASHRPAAMPSTAGRSVLQTRRTPTQLSLFPPPGLATPPRGSR